MSAVENILSATISTNVFSNRIEDDELIDLESLEVAFAALQSHFDLTDPALELLGNALNDGPTSIAATSVRFGTTSDGLLLSGNGLSQVSDIEQLFSDLDGGIASGAFDTFTVFSGGSTLLTVSFEADAYTLSAAGQSLEVGGALPNSLQEMFDFVSAFVELANATDPANPALPTIATFMDDYGLNSFAYNDGTDDLISVNINGTSVSLGVGGAEIVVDGTFPLSSLGDLVDFYIAYGDSDISNFGDIPELGLSGVTVSDREGRLLIEIEGEVTDLETTRLGTVTINGTEDRDRGIELPIFIEGSADVVNVNMLGGYDLLEFDPIELIYDDPIVETNISMGDDSGSLLLASDYRFDYDVDFAAGTVTATWLEYNGPETQEFSGTLNMLDEFRLEVGESSQFYWPFDDASLTTVAGSADDDRVVAVASGNIIEFSGGAGTDVIELHRTKLNQDDEGGITLEDFQNRVVFDLLGDQLSFEIDDDAGGPSLRLLLDEVETMRFKDGDDTVEVSVQDVLAGIGITAGSTEQDLLKGQGDGAEIFAALQGDDAVYAEGFIGRFESDLGGQVYRLYQATLDRAPDTGGYNGWIEILSSGTQELVDVSRGFVNSGEFQSVYGELSDAAFIELLYQNVLGRAADAGGLQGWLDAMEGGLAREGVVIGLSQSLEFRNNTAADAAAFAEGSDPASWTDEVYRVYRATFDRDPDVGGLAGWTELLASGTTLDQAISGFTRGAEFTNTYGASLTDEAFVELLYQNVLGRSADAGGLQGWLDAMSGGLAREGVVKGFSESGEFRNNTADDLKAWMRGNLEDDLIVVGSGTNVVSGGFGADTFEFNAELDSQTTILDLEAWDIVDIRGAGTAADITSHLVQSGSDVVFTQGEFSIVFADTIVSFVSNDIITGDDAIF